MIFTTCSLKWVNELQHEILTQLIIHSTLGIPLYQNKQKFFAQGLILRTTQPLLDTPHICFHRSISATCENVIDRLLNVRPADNNLFSVKLRLFRRPFQEI